MFMLYIPSVSIYNKLSALRLLTGLDDLLGFFVIVLTVLPLSGLPLLLILNSFS